MIIYRITREEYGDDIGGTGSKIYGGRWNPIGVSVLYGSGSRALSVLELLVNTRKNLVPPKYVILHLKIPYEDIRLIPEIPKAELPKNWKAMLPPDKLKMLGAKYLIEKKNLAIRVPSALLPSEFNIVINTSHIDFGKIKVMKTEAFAFDARLLN